MARVRTAAVAGPGARAKGEDWALDLGMDDVPAWAEFDGERKYTDPTMLRGRTAAEVVLEEKAREDWIRGSTRRPVLRWGMSHLASADTLRRRLADFHVEAPLPHRRIHASTRGSTF
ncbi:hypothetical protein [Microbacterium sp. P04]|uniref:hypothetical protein n=1 Tax=Microbacterium sp. P04 TaxID=3366947 RepID=UPI0037474340